MCRGKIIFYHGAMGSSKSLRLLTTAYNLQEKNIEYLILKPAVDTREGEAKVRSRVGLERPCALISETDNLFELVIKVMEVTKREISYVLIDEAQFLTIQQVNQLATIADELSISVYCYGLRTDFQSNLFEGSKRLFEIADSFEEVKSRCDCGNKAMMNARFNELGEIVTDGEQIMIGGNESYKPLCRKCYMEKIKESKNIKVT